MNISDQEQAGSTLYEQHQLLKSVTDNSDVALFIMDEHQHCIFMNPAAERLTGFTVDEVRGKSLHEYVHHKRPDGTSYPLCECPIDRAFPEEIRMQGEEVFIHKNGQFYDVAYTASPLRNQAGASVGTIIEVQDITARKRANEELQNTHALVDTLLETAPIGFAFLDRHLRYVRINEVLAKMNGLPVEEHIGHHVAEIVPTLANTALEVSDHIVATGEAVKNHEFSGETAAWPGLMRYWNESWYPVRDNTGTIIGFGVVAEEITARKEAERALRESELRFRAVVERIGDVFWIFDPSSKKFVYVSLAFFDLSGRNPGNVYDDSERWFEVIHHDDRSRVRADFFSHVDAGTYDVEYRVVRVDGSIRWVRDRGKSLEVDSLVAGVAEDITHRKQADDAQREAQARLQCWNVELKQAVNDRTAELQQSQDRLRALATELNLAEQRERTRLATDLHDHLQQLLVLGRMKLGGSLQRTESSASRAEVMQQLDSLLLQALTYTRSLITDLSPPALRYHGLISGLAWLVTYMKKYELTVTAQLPDEDELTLPEEQAMLLFQSVRELLINVSKHAGTGYATVRLEHRDAQVRIEVRDEGRGFDLAAPVLTADGVFSQFGLFSIRERMRALGGAFEIASAPGQGTRATLVLPLLPITVAEHPLSNHKDPVEESRGCSPRTTSPDDPQGPIRVLLVDDHAMMRQGIRSIMERYADIEVVGEACDGHEAVAASQQLRPHVVVMDINMPKKNGIEATRDIKARYPEIDVIGLSVNAGDQNQEAMLKAGALLLLSKEAAAKQLYRAIKEAVGAR